MRSIMNMISHNDLKVSVYVWVTNPSSSLNDTINKLIEDGIVEKNKDVPDTEINLNHSLLGIISDGYKDELIKALDACRSCAREIGIDIDEDGWDIVKGVVEKCATQGQCQ